MSTDQPGREAHVDKATINIEQADIRETPASRRQARTLAYALCVLFVFAIAIGAANLLFTNSQVRSVRENAVLIQQQADVIQKQIQADCGWYRDVAGLPIATAPGAPRPSATVPKLISDSRTAWHRKDCPGILPPPAPSFVRWATYYHLPVG